MKKALAVFLALVMCLSLICVPAFADTTTIDTVSFSSISGLKVKDLKVTFKENSFSIKDQMVFNLEDVAGDNPLGDNDTLTAGEKYMLSLTLEANPGCAFKVAYEDGLWNPDFALYDVNEQSVNYATYDYEYLIFVGSIYEAPMVIDQDYGNDTAADQKYLVFCFPFTATEDTGSNVIDEVTIALSGFEAGKQAAFPDIFFQPVDDYYNGNKYSIYEAAIIDITGGGEVLVNNEDYFEAGHTYMLYIGLNSFLPAVFDPDLDVNVSGAPKGYKVRNIEVETWEYDGEGTPVENGELVNASFEITFTLPGGTEPVDPVDPGFSGCSLLEAFIHIIMGLRAREAFKDMMIVKLILNFVSYVLKLF